MLLLPVLFHHTEFGRSNRALAELVATVSTCTLLVFRWDFPDFHQERKMGEPPAKCCRCQKWFIADEARSSDLLTHLSCDAPPAPTPVLALVQAAQKRDLAQIKARPVPMRMCGRLYARDDRSFLRAAARRSWRRDRSPG